MLGFAIGALLISAFFVLAGVIADYWKWIDNLDESPDDYRE